jgi:hypothetical protein
VGLIIIMIILGGVMYLIKKWGDKWLYSDGGPKEAERKATIAEENYRRAVEGAKLPGGSLYAAQQKLNRANQESERIQEALDRDRKRQSGS